MGGSVSSSNTRKGPSAQLTSKASDSGLWTRRWWGETHRPQVLVVDDDRALANLIGLSLRSSGFEVDLAMDGDSGLTQMRAKTYDAVVLDLRMPGKDGRAVFREM